MFYNVQGQRSLSSGSAHNGLHKLSQGSVKLHVNFIPSSSSAAKWHFHYNSYLNEISSESLLLNQTNLGRSARLSSNPSIFLPIQYIYRPNAATSSMVCPRRVLAGAFRCWPRIETADRFPRLLCILSFVRSFICQWLSFFLSVARISPPLVHQVSLPIVSLLSFHVPLSR